MKRKEDLIYELGLKELRRLVHSNKFRMDCLKELTTCTDEIKMNELKCFKKAKFSRISLFQSINIMHDLKLIKKKVLNVTKDRGIYVRITDLGREVLEL